MNHRKILKISAVIMPCLLVEVYGRQAQVKVLFPGNWMDPTIVKVGDNYYLTSNNDDHIPSELDWLNQTGAMMPKKN